MEHRDEGETIVGPKFRAYWERLGEKWQDNLPHVEVSVKVKEISQVFDKENTFHCRFCLQLDWEDPSLPPPGDDVDFHDHFLPRFEIDNSGEEIPEPEPGRTIKCKENARAALTVFYRGDLLSRADVSDFPFDIQLLEIVIKSRPFHVKGEKIWIALDNPTTFRPTEGHSVEPGANWNPQWHLCAITGANLKSKTQSSSSSAAAKKKKKQKSKTTTKSQVAGATSSTAKDSGDEPTRQRNKAPQRTQTNEHQTTNGWDRYCVQVKIARASDEIMVNIVFILCVVVVLSLTAYGVEVPNIFDRSSIILTALLTVVAVKWIIQDDLPRVPYLTMLDTFLLLVISQLFLSGMVFWIFAECYKAFSCSFVESNSTEDFVIGAIQLVVFICATTYLVLQRRRFNQKKSAPFKELATTTWSAGLKVLSNDPFGYSYRCRPHVDQPAEADACYATMLRRDVDSTNLETIFQGCGLNAERGREWAGQNAEVPSSMAGILQKWSSVSKGKDPEGRAAFLRGIGAQTQAEMDLLSKRLRCLQHEAAQERQWARLSTACDSPGWTLAAQDDFLLREYTTFYLRHMWDRVEEQQPEGGAALSQTVEEIVSAVRRDCLATAIPSTDANQEASPV